MPLVQLAIIVLIVLLTEAEVIRRDKVLAWKMFQFLREFDYTTVFYVGSWWRFHFFERLEHCLLLPGHVGV